jgi:release factor glutamine methyltransferase
MQSYKFRNYLTNAQYEVLLSGTHGGVMRPSPSSELLIQNLQIEGDDSVLEIGVGSGIVAIAASLLGAAAVIGTDAVGECESIVRENCRLNRVDNVDVRIGDMFAPVDGLAFDLIVMNPPSIPSLPHHQLPICHRAGRDGRQILDVFIDNLPRHLKPRGRAVFVQGSLAGLDLTLSRLRERGLQPKVVGSRELPFNSILSPEHISYITTLSTAKYSCRGNAYFETRYVVSAYIG